MFRFTIRDLLWLTVAVGLSMGWFLEKRSSYRERDSITREREVLAKKRDQIDMLDKMVTRQIGYLEHERKRLGIPLLVPTAGPDEDRAQGSDELSGFESSRSHTPKSK